MAQLTILPNSHLPIIGSSPVTAKDLAEAPPPGQTASRQSMATTSNNASITLETAEGDKVTLSYQASTTKKNYLRMAGTEIPGLEESTATHKELSVNVTGELSEQEKTDISAFKEEVSAILDNYFAANSNNSDPATLDLSKYQALSKYAIALDSSSSTSWATEMVVAVARPTQNSVEFASQQKANLTNINNNSTLTVSKDQVITKQDSPLQFDYSVSRMRQRSVEVKAQSTLHLQTSEIKIQQEAYDKQRETPLIAGGYHPQPMNLPDFSELRTATQEIFAQQSAFLKNDSKIQQLNTLENDFIELIDHLTTKSKEASEQPTIMTSV